MWEWNDVSCWKVEKHTAFCMGSVFMRSSGSLRGSLSPCILPTSSWAASLTAAILLLREVWLVFLVELPMLLPPPKEMLFARRGVPHKLTALTPAGGPSQLGNRRVAEKPWAPMWHSPFAALSLSQTVALLSEGALGKNSKWLYLCPWLNTSSRGCSPAVLFPVIPGAVS